MSFPPDSVPDPGRPASEPDDNPGPVRLVSVTPDAEAQILYCARVSSDQDNTDVGLIRYLIRNGHWSPFELAHAVVEIRTSRAIAAQILRHRSFSFQEFSQRYSVAPGTVKYKARRQAEKNRQSSVDDLPADAVTYFDALQASTERHCRDMYERALASGVAREQARFLLPLATETTLYVAGSIRSWVHYFEQRCDDHTQQEHRDLAFAARDLLAAELPTVAEAMSWAVAEPPRGAAGVRHPD